VNHVLVTFSLMMRAAVYSSRQAFTMMSKDVKMNQTVAPAGIMAALSTLRRICKERFLKRPPKTPDRVYPVVKNQEYDRVYDWEYRPG
jgi:hypothetical protein